MIIKEKKLLISSGRSIQRGEKRSNFFLNRKESSSVLYTEKFLYTDQSLCTMKRPHMWKL